MMSNVLSDVFIGNSPVTQIFGANPNSYAKFGLRGHNGIDFGCPPNTQIVATADGVVQEVASDPTGYGNYVKIQHDSFLSLYAHLDHATVSVGKKVLQGQLIGFSDNTGNSTGPHLHFGIAPCDSNGIKIDPNNGYAGYIDPDSYTWDIKNLKEPVPTVDLIPVPKTDFENLVTKSTNCDVIATYLKLDDLDKEFGKIVVAQFEDLKHRLENSSPPSPKATTKVSGGSTSGNAGGTQGNPQIPDIHSTPPSGNTVNSGTFNPASFESSNGPSTGSNSGTTYVPPTPQAPQKSFLQFLQDIFKRIWEQIPMKEVR